MADEKTRGTFADAAATMATAASHALYDLHLHTCWSYDATIPVESYFRHARELGIRCLAITDHHVLDSLDEFLERIGERAIR